MAERILPPEAITRAREALSPKTELLWNPVTGDGKIVFHVEDLVTENDVAVGLLPNKKLRTVSRSISSLVNESIDVDVGGSMVNVPYGLVILAIKGLFNQAYLEDLEALSVSPTPPSSNMSLDHVREMIELRRNRMRGVDEV